MLKSQVPFFLCSSALVLSLPLIANSGRSFSSPGKDALSPVDKISFNLSSKEVIAFVPHSRQMTRFVSTYIVSNEESLSAIRQGSKRPFSIIDSVLNHYRLPSELKYLAVIESELKVTAVSRVGARGPWQLMASTARELGLKVNGRQDERLNYYKSTKAAALYLRDLHNEFKDWLLVLAAYNAGPLPVYKAMHRAHSRNFWALERYLPTESRQHVKRFIATACYFDNWTEYSMNEAAAARLF